MFGPIQALAQKLKSEAREGYYLNPRLKMKERGSLWLCKRETCLSSSPIAPL